MTQNRLSVMIAVAALASAAAGGAYAADKPSKKLDFSVKAEPTTPAFGPGKTLKWDASKGRWGLTLNMQEVEARPSTLNDVEAGAYYRITPSLRVGGSVGVGERLPGTPGSKALTTRSKAAAAEEPRVRLQTEFKF